MRVLKILSICLFAVVLIVAIAGFIGIQAGPRATGPSENPIVRLNRERANVPDNADELYGSEIAAAVGDPPDSGNWRVGQPVPAALVEFVAAHQDALRLARQAAERENYWHPLQADEYSVSLRNVAQLRRLVRLLWWNAQIAIENRDAGELGESLVHVAQIGQHAGQTPILIYQLIAHACLATAQQGLLEPLRWPELSAEARRAYIDCGAPVATPPPALTEALAVEEDWACWTYAGFNRGKLSTIVMPASRIYGEFHAAFQPLRELAAQTLEEQARRDNPLYAAIGAKQAGSPLIPNAPRVAAEILVPSQARAIELRVRTAAAQRGNRTVLELFRLRDNTGEFPATLDAIVGDFKIDPYSGKPFVYRKAGDDFVLYSLGIDNDDDGGKHEGRFGELRNPNPNLPPPPPDGDYVFWPPVEDDGN